MLRALIFILLTAGLAAQAEPLRQITATPEENLIEGDVVHGAYGGPRVAYGRVAGQDGIFVGGEGGWIINHSIIIGGAGYGLATEQPAPGVWSSNNNLNFGYGGAMIGYTFLPQRLVHGTFTALIGAGGLGLRHFGGGDTDLHDAVFVFEPTATVDLNVARNFRAGLSVSWRFVRGVQTDGITNSDLSGLMGSMILKFGKF